MAPSWLVFLRPNFISTHRGIMKGMEEESKTSFLTNSSTSTLKAKTAVGRDWLFEKLWGWELPSRRLTCWFCIQPLLKSTQQKACEDHPSWGSHCYWNASVISSEANWRMFTFKSESPWDNDWQGQRKSNNSTLRETRSFFSLYLKPRK